MDLSELKKILKADQILTDSDSLKKYGRDWTTAYESNAAAVVFIQKQEELVQILKWANQNKIVLIPSGGRTGLSGGAVATKGEIIISFERMNRILGVDSVEQTIRCEAGVITEDLQNAARDAGFYFPVDFASRGSSQIGGNIATNAGGIRVIRYGLMRDWVLSLKVATGSGEVLELGRDLIKDNSGYDFKHLFIGSEGTLGFILEATLKLTKPPTESSVLLLASNNLSSALELLKTFRSRLTCTAFEFFTDAALRRVMESHQLERPFSTACPNYFLIEVENPDEKLNDEILAAFDEAMEKNLVIDGVISQNSQQKEKFWKYRENISESLSRFTPYKADVSVKTSKIPEFVQESEKALRQKFSGLEIVWFGHIGDGNLHINLLKPQEMSKDEFKISSAKISEILFPLIQEFSGSISAEHGIGLVKKPYLQFSRTSVEISLMKKMKAIFDPAGILNAGKIFDL